MLTVGMPLYIQRLYWLKTLCKASLCKRREGGEEEQQEEERDENFTVQTKEQQEDWRWGDPGYFCMGGLILGIPVTEQFQPLTLMFLCIHPEQALSSALLFAVN